MESHDLDLSLIPSLESIPYYYLGTSVCFPDPDLFVLLLVLYAIVRVLLRVARRKFMAKSRSRVGRVRLSAVVNTHCSKRRKSNK